MSKIELTNNLYLNILNSIPTGIILVTEIGIIIYSNLLLNKIFGYDEKELLGCHINKLLPTELKKQHEINMTDFIRCPTERAMANGRVLRAIKKNGQEIQLEIALTPINENCNYYILVSILEYENDIFKLSAYNDNLTGLPNKSLFLTLGKNLRNLAIRSNVPLTVIFIDLDNFKSANDHFGHDIGDQILCKVADILHESIRKNDIAARIGGDEFLLCFYDMNQNDILNKISKKLLSKITSINKVNGNAINISASIGCISLNDANIMSLEEMITIADQLMYRGKNSGKNQIFSEQR